MWSIAGGIAVISFLVSPVGQRIIKGLSTPQTSVILEERRADNLGSSRQANTSVWYHLDSKSFQRRVEDYTILDALTVGILVSIRIKQGDSYIL